MASKKAQGLAFEVIGKWIWYLLALIIILFGLVLYFSKGLRESLNILG